MQTFSSFQAVCEGYPPVNGGFASLRPPMLSCGIFVAVSLNTLLHKQSICRWLETQWRWCNVQKCSKEIKSTLALLVVELLWPCKIYQQNQLLSGVHFTEDCHSLFRFNGTSFYPKCNSVLTTKWCVSQLTWYRHNMVTKNWNDTKQYFHRIPLVNENSFVR